MSPKQHQSFASGTQTDNVWQIVDVRYLPLSIRRPLRDQLYQLIRQFEDLEAARAVSRSLPPVPAEHQLLPGYSGGLGSQSGGLL